MDKRTLRLLTLKALSQREPEQIQTLISTVETLATKHEASTENRVARRFDDDDLVLANEIIWDLIVERVLSVGYNSSNLKLPFIRLTDYGKELIHNEETSYYDPDKYIENLKQIAPTIDDVILQYSGEGLLCYRKMLYFASAVMFGAASEKAIMLLLKAITEAEALGNNKKDNENLLTGQSLPKIFEAIQEKLDSYIKAKTLPYNIHQGCTTHLLSLFESIRVQRNDAVHPNASRVSKSKVFLTIQTFPSSMEAIYRIITYLKNKQSD